MDPKIIAFAAPALAVLVILEWTYARRARITLYRFHETLADVGCGISAQIVKGCVVVSTLSAYDHIHQTFGTTSWPLHSPWAWLAAIVLFDHSFYWWHRYSHQINVLWAVHVVHHQSEAFNLAVALRIAWFSSLTDLPFYLPLAIIGIPAPMFATIGSLNLLYQFWIHTQIVGRLGWAEWILNTPSHHRVHHGRNPEYIDKNFGGIFIVFDRIFGTFQQESIKPLYGVLEPHRSRNPVWANFGYWTKLWQGARHSDTLIERIKIWFARPSSISSESGTGERPKWITPRTSAQNGYLGVHFIVLLIATGRFLHVQQDLPIFEQVVFGGLLVWTTANLGALIEGRRWGTWSEISRHGIVSSIGLVSGLYGRLTLPSGIALAASLLLSFVIFHRNWNAPVLEKSPNPPHLAKARARRSP